MALCQVGMEFNTARVLPVFHFFRYSFHFELATSCRTSGLTGSLAFGTPGIACTDGENWNAPEPDTQCPTT